MPCLILVFLLHIPLPTYLKHPTILNFHPHLLLFKTRKICVENMGFRGLLPVNVWMLGNAEFSWETSELDEGKRKSLKGPQVKGSKMVPHRLSKKLGIIAIFLNTGGLVCCFLFMVLDVEEREIGLVFCRKETLVLYRTISLWNDGPKFLLLQIAWDCDNN